MIFLFLILVPFISAVLAFLAPKNYQRKMILLAAALIHGGCVIGLWMGSADILSNGFLGIDALGKLVLLIVSILFIAVAIYLRGYLENGEEHSNRIFIGFLLLFISSMTLAAMSRHMGLLWVAIEATTLFSAPLINFYRSPQSVEATWKYLLVCSVGIAMALLGTFFLAISAGQISSLFLGSILNQAGVLSIPWLQLSIIFLFVGYGTKMGLAPMHTWLPDAHSEAPPPISALLSGVLLNCAFLGILRVWQICAAAGQIIFARDILLVMGILSLLVAAVFVVGQSDYKRMLAYSSVENMGILALGLGLGGIGLYASLWHMVNNAFAKGMIFLVTGNLYQYYHSKKVGDVHGLLSRFPATGVLFLIGFGAVAGLPPFGTFYSELMILDAALKSHRYFLAFFYILFLSIIFIGMAQSALKMLHPGSPVQEKDGIQKENLFLIIPIALLGVIVCGLGVYLPAFLRDILRQCTLLLGG